MHMLTSGVPLASDVKGRFPYFWADLFIFSWNMPHFTKHNTLKPKSWETNCGHPEISGVKTPTSISNGTRYYRNWPMLYGHESLNIWYIEDADNVNVQIALSTWCAIHTRNRKITKCKFYVYNTHINANFTLWSTIYINLVPTTHSISVYMYLLYAILDQNNGN